jgi:hypothetical protein
MLDGKKCALEYVVVIPRKALVENTPGDVETDNGGMNDDPQRYLLD